MRNILKQLSQLQDMREDIAPSVEWKAQARAQLMSQIRNTVSEEQVTKGFSFDSISKALNIFVSPRAMAISRAALVFVLVVGVAFAGWNVSVRASSDSLPGDRLWSVKLALERTEIAVTNSKKKKAALHVKFAGRRAEEINEVVKRKSANEVTVSVATALTSLKDSIESANVGLEDIKDDSSEEIVELAELIDQASKEIIENLHKTLDSVKHDLEDEQDMPEIEGVEDLVKNVDDAVDVAEDSGAKSLGILVEQNLENPDDAVAIDLKQRVEEKLEEAVIQFVDLEHGVEELVSTSTTLPIIDFSVEEITSSTEAVLESIKQTEEKLEDAKDRIDEVFEDALEFLESDALLDALNGLQELKEITSDLEDVADESEVLIENEIDNTTEVLGEKVEEGITSSTPETSGSSTNNGV